MTPHLNELLALTKQYICEEFPPDMWIATDKDTHVFFRNLAMRTNPRQKAASTPLPRSPAKSLMPKPAKKTPVTVDRPLVKREETPPPPKPISLKQEAKDEPLDLKPQLELLSQVCPSIKIIEEIPAPSGPKNVLIVLAEECEEERQFWKKVAKALADRGVLVELKLLVDCKERDSEENLILVPRSIMSHFKDDKIPVIQTEKARLYQQDIYLKRGLWQTLCKTLRI